MALISGGTLALFAEDLLRLFGSNYVEAATALRVLVVGQFINATAGSCGVILSMTGHQREVVNGVAGALVVNFALSILLIPGLGIIGAAIAAATGLAVWNAYLAYRAIRLVGINTTILNPRTFLPPH